MKRTLKLREMQLLDTLKVVCIIFAIGATLLTVLGLLGHLLSPDAVLIRVNSLTDVRWVLDIISKVFSIWVFCILFRDGITDFDTAVRFGHSRRNYVICNFGIYTLISLATTLFQAFEKKSFSGSSLTMDFWQTLAFCFVIAIISFAIYKWGWKILLLLFAVNIFSAVILGFLTSMFGDYMNRMDQFLSHLPDVAIKGIATLALIGIVTVYCWVVSKIEVK